MKRKANAGAGNLFNFHGNFARKEDAMAKEQATPGAFIKTIYPVGKEKRYLVMTKRNPVTKKQLERAIRKAGGKVWTLRPMKKVAAAVHKNLPSPKRRRKNAFSLRKLFTKARSRTRFAQRAGDIAGRKRLEPFNDQETTLGRSTGGYRPPRRRRAGGRSVKHRSARGPASTGVVADVTSALVNLRYKPALAQKLAQQAQGDTFNERMRSALALAPQKANPRSTARVEQYKMRTAAGKHIRIATRVIFPDGRKVEFIDRLPKGEAIRQAQAHLARRANPDAAKLYTRFHGKHPDRVKPLRVRSGVGPTSDVAGLGELLAIHTVTDDYRYLGKFTGKGVQVVATPDGKQMYFVGGDQNIDAQAVGFAGRRAAGKQLIDLGRAYHIAYLAQKRFDNFQKISYEHDFGLHEVHGNDKGAPIPRDNYSPGELPRLMYDYARKQLSLVGGIYVAKPEGIVN